MCRNAQIYVPHVTHSLCVLQRTMVVTNITILGPVPEDEAQVSYCRLKRPNIYSNINFLDFNTPSPYILWDILIQTQPRQQRFDISQSGNAYCFYKNVSGVTLSEHPTFDLVYDLTPKENTKITLLGLQAQAVCYPPNK